MTAANFYIKYNVRLLMLDVFKTDTVYNSIILNNTVCIRFKLTVVVNALTKNT